MKKHIDIDAEVRYSAPSCRIIAVNGVTVLSGSIDYAGVIQSAEEEDLGTL